MYILIFKTLRIRVYPGGPFNGLRPLWINDLSCVDDMFFSYDQLQFQYEPFPIGLAKPIMEDSIYQELIEQYPPVEIFKSLPKIGSKFSLSERYHSKEYQNFIESNPVWREFHRWIKSDAFINEIMDVLRKHHIDLGYGLPPPSAAKRVRKFIKSLSRGQIPASTKLQSRFEFSMLPAAGGHVLPHSDAPAKIVTLIVSMVREGEWDPAFGGGTDVNRPKSDLLSFNQLNRNASFEDMEVLNTFDFTPNQAVIFIKTFNSWHSVRPMTGMNSTAMRKTLTINIEEVS